jgi:hypothetical protein
MATTADAAADLDSWRDDSTKRAIVEFIARVTGEHGSEPVPVEERLTVFDNDRTLRCEDDADPARLPAPARQSSIRGDHSCPSGRDDSDERSGPRTRGDRQ